LEPRERHQKWTLASNLIPPNYFPNTFAFYIPNTHAMSPTKTISGSTWRSSGNPLHRQI